MVPNTVPKKGDYLLFFVLNSVLKKVEKPKKPVILTPVSINKLSTNVIIGQKKNKQKHLHVLSKGQSLNFYVISLFKPL